MWCLLLAIMTFHSMLPLQGCFLPGECLPQGPGEQDNTRVWESSQTNLTRGELPFLALSFLESLNSPYCLITSYLPPLPDAKALGIDTMWVSQPLVGRLALEDTACVLPERYLRIDGQGWRQGAGPPWEINYNLDCPTRYWSTGSLSLLTNR
jgi:hypothetical protein